MAAHQRRFVDWASRAGHLCAFIAFLLSSAAPVAFLITAQGPAVPTPQISPRSCPCVPWTFQSPGCCSHRATRAHGPSHRASRAPIPNPKRTRSRAKRKRKAGAPVAVRARDCEIDVRDASELTAEEFQMQYYLPRRPVRMYTA